MAKTLLIGPFDYNDSCCCRGRNSVLFREIDDGSKLAIAEKWDCSAIRFRRRRRGARLVFLNIVT